MAGRNRRAGKHGARKPQRAAERALRQASLGAMIYKTRWPGRVRSFVSQEMYRGDRTTQEASAHDSFVAPDHASFLSAPEGLQGVPHFVGEDE